MSKLDRDNPVGRAVLDLEGELSTLRRALVDGESMGQHFACMTSDDQAAFLSAAWVELASESEARRETQLAYLAQDMEHDEEAVAFVVALVAALRERGVAIK